MARPKKIPDSSNEMDAAEREFAPVTETVAVVEPQVMPPQVFAPPVYQPLAPRQMHIERQGSQSEPRSRRFPEVHGGVCEYCGVLDKNVPSKFQYKLCEHFRGMQLWCTYCPDTKDPDDVVEHANLKVAEDPFNPSSLIVWCDSTNCSKAHHDRFNRSKS